MKWSVLLAVLAACAAGAGAVHIPKFLSLSGAPAPPSPPSNPVVTKEMFADKIDPVVKFIADGTPPDVKHPFEALLGPYGPLPKLKEQSSVLQWHELLLACVRAFTSISPYPSYPTAVARALYIVQTAVFDAWAAYDKEAIGVYWPKGNSTSKDFNAADYRRPASERSPKNKAEAAAFAAYQATISVFPNAEESLLKFLKATTPNYSNDMLTCKDMSVAACLGNSAAANVIDARKHDGSNQATGYADNGDFKYPEALNLSAWQRLTYKGKVQGASTPFWRYVDSFALKRSNQFIPPDTTTFLVDTDEYNLQAANILAYSADLDDRTKVIGDYWADFPSSNLPPGHWTQYAEWVLSTAPQGKYTLDDEIKLLFALSAGLLDASISAWDTKYQYLSVRPITAITKVVFEGQEVVAYKRGNPQSKTPSFIKGNEWEPFQPVEGITPPFPAFVSGHSTFGGVFETVMQKFTNSDKFGLEIVVPKGYLPSEKDVTFDVPAMDFPLYYPSFSYASQENGISRLYNGVHFSNDNICGRAQGIAAGLQAWERYEALLAGKDIKKSDPEDPKVRTTFEDFMGAATLTSTGHTVKQQIVA